MRPDDPERRLRERLDALGPAPRAELLHVLMLPDLERADRIGEFRGYPQSRAFAKLLIDCEEDRTLRAVPVGMLRGGQPRTGLSHGPHPRDRRVPKLRHMRDALNWASTWRRFDRLEGREC